MPRPLRVVRLKGQLGNHLFQWAMVRGLDPDGGPVLVDAAGVDSSKGIATAVRPEGWRPFTAAEALRLRRVPTVFGRRWQRRFDARRHPRVRAALDRRIYDETAWGRYEPAATVVAAPVFYRGYFQHEDYFAHAADAVVAGLRPARAEAAAAVASATPPGSGALVAVHVRAAADYEGWGPERSWFERAAAEVVDRLGAVRFAVTSDVDGARDDMIERLRPFGPAGALRAGPYDTIRAIALCDHAILSPSSFSWWGAWLGDHRSGFDPARVVVAPSHWVQAEQDPAPARWIRVG